MDQPLFYAYRSYGDPAGARKMTISSDPNTGDDPHLHAAGDVIAFYSEGERDAYVARQVVVTTLEGGHHRRFHWVSPVTTEKARRFLEACAARPTCIHKTDVRRGQVRIPE